jgi:hypothetical protein
VIVADKPSRATGSGRRREAARLAAAPVAVALALALALLFAGAAGAAPVQSVPATPAELAPEQAVRAVLSSPRYAFCSDAAYQLTLDEVGWCGMLPVPPDERVARCPKLRLACKLGPTAKTLDKPKKRDFDMRLPSFGGLGQAVFWLLVLGAVALVVYLVLRSGVGMGESDPAQQKEGGPVRASGRPEDAVAQAVERDVQRLLARARAAAAAGDYGAAVADLHAALLRRLEGEGHVRIHPSATNGDYVRELRGRAPALVAPVRAVVHDVEAVQFGATAADDGAYRSVLARVTPLVAAAGRAMVSLAVFLCLIPSCDPSFRSDPEASPSGAAAVVDFLSSTGIKARLRYKPLGDLANAASAPKTTETETDAEGKAEEKTEEKTEGKTDAKTKDYSEPPRQVVLLPEATVGDAEWKALHAWMMQSGGRVVVAGSRSLPAWLPVEIVEREAKGPVRPAADLIETSDNGRLEGKVPGGAWVRPGPRGGVTLLVREERAYAIEVEPEAIADDGGGKSKERSQGQSEEKSVDLFVARAHGRRPAARAPRKQEAREQPGRTGDDVQHGPVEVQGDGEGEGEDDDGDEDAADDDGHPAADGPVYARLPGRVLVVADHRLFTNASLAVGDNAALLFDLLGPGGWPVELAGSFTGLVATTPLQSVARGKLAPFMLQLGACLIVFFLMKGIAFGRLRDPLAQSRRRFSEHVRAVGTHYARARAARHALEAYASWCVDRMRERIRLPGDRGLGDLASAVAARTNKPLGEVARVLFEVRRDERAAGAPVAPAERTRSAAEPYLALMRELRQLVVALTDPRRAGGGGGGTGSAETASTDTPRSSTASTASTSSISSSTRTSSTRPRAND